MRASILGLLLACGSATEPAPAADVDAGSCRGTPTCTLEHGSCCDDVGFSPTCVDGAWVCDPCDVPEFEFACGRRSARLTGTCERWVREGVRLGEDLVTYCAE